MRLLLLALGALSACATDVAEFRTADGHEAYALDCSDTLSSSMADCYREAARRCPQGFDVINQHASDGLLTLERALTIKCKRPP